MPRPQAPLAVIQLMPHPRGPIHSSTGERRGMDNLLKPVIPVTPSKAPNTHSKPMDRIETSHSFDTVHASALESIKAAVLQVFFL